MIPILVYEEVRAKLVMMAAIRRGCGCEEIKIRNPVHTQGLEDVGL